MPKLKALGGMTFVKYIVVAAHLRGMWPAPSTDKNILTPNEKLKTLNTSQGTNEDDSQNDPRPEAGLFYGQVTQNSGPENRHDMVTGVQKVSHCGHDMVRGATETNRNRHDMVTGNQRESLRQRHSDRSHTTNR